MVLFMYFWCISELGRIRAAVHMRVRPDSDGRPISEFSPIRAGGRVWPDADGFSQIRVC